MNTFYIKHKVSEQDIVHLSDSDSEFVIRELKLDIEDIVQIETYEAFFLAMITDIEGNSVEIEIREKVKDKENIQGVGITLIQSLVNRSKFNYFLEKSVEIGVDRIIPIESQYSLLNKNKALKEYGLWQKIVKDATEQSRNIKPTSIEKPIKIDELRVEERENKICLATENVKSTTLKEYMKVANINKSFTVAIGPEKGWSSDDIKSFKKLGFSFIKLNGNILRTESTGLVITSIIKYLKGEI